MAQLAEPEVRERETQQRQRAGVQAVARVREETMAEARHLKALAAVAKKEEGAALLAQAQREMAEDQAKVQAQKQRCAARTTTRP